MNTAKLSSDGTQQTVILPPDFQMTGTEVYIKKIGNAIILISKENPWQSLIDSLDQFSDDFMNTRDQLPVDKREEF
ncbi:type II toxin-antitoxin system VapB family antitoxin [Sphaerospermopsis kisseleviana CS-549]|uniref:Type II toxin-antitoxin system VapB family antitoxin n=1 Tax=Sphaerospermopsis kisseleviana CS-549 TaxID=3021783 RepID=A0ABT4ZWV6_9CYAN|nr:type II toxin-antitoxin system VapB family antitoxin [Sphaerospermopsis kisseleviana]MDB9443897.1 type II toxin-antitoxin system VapB family antitoxin [Sphaerospermopsis kisseleviana CS-549]BAZ82987.1 virulence associated protein B [Sphaerospermopsis kisseleviana NIES-73]